MFKKLDILDEKDKRLRQISKDITFPITKKDRELIQRMIDELTYSQIEEYEKKYHLRPGMGLAYPQLGINKRVIVIVHEVDDGIFDNYVVLNPKIVSNSEEIIAAEAGEGRNAVNNKPTIGKIIFSVCETALGGFIRIRRSFFVVSKRINGGWIIGTNAMYE